MASLKKDKLAWFLQKRAPVMIWMIVIWTIISVSFEYFGMHLYPWERYPYFHNYYSFPSPFGNIWFIYALFFLSAFSAITYKMKISNQVLIAIFISLLMSFISSSYIFEDKINYILIRNLAFKGFPFFVFGFIFKDRIVNTLKDHRKVMIIFILSSFSFFILHFLNLPKGGYFDLFFRYIPGTVSFTSFVVILSRFGLLRILFTHIGKISLQIFLLHIFFISFMSIIYSKYVIFNSFGDRLFLIFSPAVLCFIFIKLFGNIINPYLFSLPKYIQEKMLTNKVTY